MDVVGTIINIKEDILIILQMRATHNTTRRETALKGK